MYCSQCATPLTRDDVYCPSCSKPVASFAFDDRQIRQVELIEEDTAVKSSPQRPRQTRIWTAIFVAVAGLAVIFIAALISFLGAMLYRYNAIERAQSHPINQRRQTTTVAPVSTP